ncbi:hypothetical protein J6590_052049 [Homalodisca vitripennis]|nr:hypothetical protein J6590_052049 [Homalodisca vitripennis]
MKVSFSRCKSNINRRINSHLDHFYLCHNLHTLCRRHVLCLDVRYGVAGPGNPFWEGKDGLSLGDKLTVNLSQYINSHGNSSIALSLHSRQPVGRRVTLVVAYVTTYSPSSSFSNEAVLVSTMARSVVS